MKRNILIKTASPKLLYYNFLIGKVLGSNKKVIYFVPIDTYIKILLKKIIYLRSILQFNFHV